MDKKRLGNIAFIAALILGASSCVEKDVYQSSQEKKSLITLIFLQFKKISTWKSVIPTAV